MTFINSFFKKSKTLSEIKNVKKRKKPGKNKKRKNVFYIYALDVPQSLTMSTRFDHLRIPAFQQL